MNHVAPPWSSLVDLKASLYAKTGIPPHMQVLYGGVTWKNGDTSSLTSLGVGNLSTLHLCTRLLGGAPEDHPVQTEGDPPDDTPSSSQEPPLHEMVALQGKTTLYSWKRHPQQGQGFSLLQGWYYNEKQGCPRMEMLCAILRHKPWEWELSDGWSSPSHMSGRTTEVYFPHTGSLSAVPEGSTGVWTLPTWTSRKEDAYDWTGHPLLWTGNQQQVIADLVRKLDSEAKSIFLWVILETRQPPCMSPSFTLQLEGRHVTRLLRKKCISFIYDKSGKNMQRNPVTGLWENQSPWAMYHMAFLLHSKTTWKDLTSINSEWVVNQNAFPSASVAVCIKTLRIVTPTTVQTTNEYYRWLNDAGDAGSATARRMSRIAWSGARKLPAPDPETQLWEHTFPEEAMQTVVERLQTEKVQFIDLTSQEDIFVILQAKASKKATTHSAVTCPLDLMSEITASLDCDMPLQSFEPFAPHVFPQTVPHIRYQRLVTLAKGVDIADLSRRLWEGGRLVLKTMSTDRRIRFGTWARRNPMGVGFASLLKPGVSIMAAPLGVSISQARKYFVLLGSLEDVSEVLPQLDLTRVCYRCLYTHKESAALADGIIFDSALGEITLHGIPNKEVEERMKSEVSDAMQEDGVVGDDDSTWWKLEAGKLLGASAAVEAENHRITAANLAALSQPPSDAGNGPAIPA